MQIRLREPFESEHLIQFAAWRRVIHVDGDQGRRFHADSMRRRCGALGTAQRSYFIWVSVGGGGFLVNYALCGEATTFPAFGPAQ